MCGYPFTLPVACLCNAGGACQAHFDGTGYRCKVAQALGYGTFSNLQRALRGNREKVLEEPGDISSKGADNEDNSPFDIVFEMERSLMDETHSLINKEDFDHATKILGGPRAGRVSNRKQFVPGRLRRLFSGDDEGECRGRKGTDLSDMNVILMPWKNCWIIYRFPDIR